MARPKGLPKTGGRKKGVTNKNTTELKTLVFNALHAGEGAEKWLVQQKQDNPVAFMTLLGKFVPRDLNVGGQPDNPVITQSISPPAMTADEWLERYRNVDTSAG